MERLTQRVKDGILVKESHGENSMKTMYQCFGDKPNENYFNCDDILEDVVTELKECDTDGTH